MAFAVINGSSNNYSSTFKSSYDGSKVGGELDTWKTYGSDPNDFTVDNFEKLIDRQVALYIINSIANAVINKPLTYSIGSGVLFRSHVLYNQLGLNEKAGKRFSNEFTELLDIEKRAVNYYQKQ